MIDLDDCVEVAKRFGATAVNSAASEALGQQTAHRPAIEMTGNFPFEP
jgi:hypothetical protein